jgi:galactonate dehydratase
MGPLQIVAGAHAMLTIPNFYRLEHSLQRIPSYQRCLDRPIEFSGDSLHLPDRPGLGVDVDPDFLRENLVRGWSDR